MLKTVQSYYSEKSRLYESQNPNASKIEYLRWTFAQPKEIGLSKNSIIDLFIKQVN